MVATDGIGAVSRSAISQPMNKRDTWRMMTMRKNAFSECVNDILAASPRSTIDIPPRSLRDSLIATANAWRDFYRQAKSANYRSDHIDMAIRVSIQQSDPDDDNAKDGIGVVIIRVRLLYRH